METIEKGGYVLVNKKIIEMIMYWSMKSQERKGSMLTIKKL